MSSGLSLDEVLAAARAGAEPEPGEAARVRERLHAVPPAPLPPPALAETRQAAGTSLRQLALWSAGAGLFMAGFLLGRSTVPSASAPELPVPAATQQQTAERSPPVEKVTAPRPVLLQPQAPAPSAESDGASPAVTPAMSHAKIARAQRSLRSRAASTDLREVVRRLREAQRALRANDGARALAVLDQLDRRFASALLAEERQVTRVLALCDTGQPDLAQQLARELLRAHPGSVYSTRLAHSCAELQDGAALLEAIKQRVRE